MSSIYYTDGSCSPNPGPGGFAVIKDMKVCNLGGEADSTNIRMEGFAIVAALKDAAGQPCQIYTDSEFWINVITKWSLGWEARGWKKSGGPIKNLDIVQEVCPLFRKSQAQLTWVRGHNNDPGNEMADEWANRAREQFLAAHTARGTDREHLSTPFDHPVEVGGQTMNVNVQGSGDKNVVLLSGRGVTAPSYDFAPLITQLKDSSTVFTIDYFGTGLSNMTDIPRTSEQIAHEVHEALARLGVKKYTLVAHSISGIYGLHYVNLYPDEVTSFVGIDTATPRMDQYITPELLEETSAPPPDPDKPHDVREDIADVKGYEYSDKEIAIMQALYDRNCSNDDKFEAMKTHGPTDEREEKPYDSMRFPDSIPTKFFLSSESVELAPDWYKREHEKQLTPAPGSSVIVLRGGHFLHHSQAAAIAQGIKN